MAGKRGRRVEDKDMKIDTAMPMKRLDYSENLTERRPQEFSITNAFMCTQQPDWYSFKHT